jgi:hypothetical protein
MSDWDFDGDEDYYDGMIETGFWLLNGWPLVCLLGGCAFLGIAHWQGWW